MKLGVGEHGTRLPVMGFLYPEVDGDSVAMTPTMVTTGTAKCMFRVPIETLTTSFFAEACGQSMSARQLGWLRWTRTHQMGHRHFGVGSRELLPWEPLDFDPIYYGERLDLLFNVRWTDKLVGAAVARVTVLLAMNRYVRS